MTEVPDFLDTSVPNVARVYDYWLDGKNNFAADRALAEQMLKIFPGLRELVRENRQFITRAVSWVAGQGIDQFVDAGAGLPSTPSTHESAQAINPEASVVYLDNDPVVVSHARALLSKGQPGVSVAKADLRDPDAVLNCPGIDASRPLCLILAAVLHLMDAESARRVAAGDISRLASGSYVIISMARYDDPVLAERIVAEYSAAASFFNHSAEDAASFFTGLELIEPGLASGRTWRGNMPDPGLPRSDVYALVGVGRKPLAGVGGGNLRWMPSGDPPLGSRSLSGRPAQRGT